MKWIRKNIACRFIEWSHDYHNPNPITLENPITDEESQNPKTYWFNRGRFCCKHCGFEYPENKKMMQAISNIDGDSHDIAVPVGMVVIKSMFKPTPKY